MPTKLDLKAIFLCYTSKFLALKWQKKSAGTNTEKAESKVFIKSGVGQRQWLRFLSLLYTLHNKERNLRPKSRANQAKILDVVNIFKFQAKQPYFLPDSSAWEHLCKPQCQSSYTTVLYNWHQQLFKLGFVLTKTAGAQDGLQQELSLAAGTTNPINLATC